MCIMRSNIFEIRRPLQKRDTRNGISNEKLNERAKFNMGFRSAKNLIIEAGISIQGYLLIVGYQVVKLSKILPDGPTALLAMKQ